MSGAPIRYLVAVTARSGDGRHDLASRFFAPQAARLGTNQLTGYQASPRGGTVLVRVAGERVHLGAGR